MKTIPVVVDSNFSLKPVLARYGKKVKIDSALFKYVTLKDLGPYPTKLVQGWLFDDI